MDTQRSTHVTRSHQHTMLKKLIPLLLISCSAHADVSFIAIGDTPYNERQQEALDQEIAPRIKRGNYPFVIHYGDFKNGRESCTKTLMTQRRDDIYALLPNRVFYTPGDNDWTDCDRVGLREPQSELASLALLRQLFFAKPLELPESWQYARQADYPENARWFYNGVLFATIHQVATTNGRDEILRDDVKTALEMVDARDQANLAWLQATFYQAELLQAEAVVITSQAEINNSSGLPCNEKRHTYCDPYKQFRVALRQHSKHFNKPVLYLHGDTPQYCMDKQFGGTEAPKLWRLNAWGDYREAADATVVNIQPEHPNTPFSASTLMGGAVAGSDCRSSGLKLWDILGR